MTEKERSSYQYGPVPKVYNDADPEAHSNNDSSDSGNHGYGGYNMSSESFQRGLHTMYSSDLNFDSFGRRNCMMVCCMFVVFLVLISGSGRHAEHPVSADVTSQNHSNDNVEAAPVNGAHSFVDTPSTPQTSENSYEPQTSPYGAPPAAPTSTPAPSSDNKNVNDERMSWLMAFPMSGVSYTFHLLSSLTSHETKDDESTLTLGTNYAISAEQPPIFENLRSPYLYRKKEYPRIHHNHNTGNLALVLTHCGSRCSDVDNCSHAVETLWTFDTECRLTLKPDAHEMGQIDIDFVPKNLINYQKAIHLVRDPLANLVSIFHLQHFEHLGDPTWQKMFPNTEDGYHAWCEQQVLPEDMRWILGEFASLHADKLNNIPCLFQLFQYVQWHISAYELHQGSAHVVRFEDYSQNNAINVGTSMLHYLDIDSMGNYAPEFRGANMYQHYYSNEQREDMWALLKSMAPEHIFNNLWSTYHE